ncbi:MAG: alginate export family protein [Panacagrimonas sp.]
MSFAFHALRRAAAPLALLGAVLAPVPGVQAAPDAAPSLVFSHNLRYRYEYFSRDRDAVTPPDAESKASVLRLALGADATLTRSLGLFAEFEHVAQVGEDDYNIPTIPGQAMPGFPVIADPEGSEINQAYVRIKGPFEATLKVGRQELQINNGRFVSISGWRQNHISYDGATLALAPADGWNLQYGYLSKYLRVTGSEASNGRAEMSSNLFNIKRSFGKDSSLAFYGVLLDFDDEPANSTNSLGLRFEGRRALGSSFTGLATLEYAQQKDSADNPNEVDAAYVLVDLGIEMQGIALRAAYDLREGRSATDKFQTPLAHPFNGWTELFLTTPSLGADNHGLQAISLAVGGPVAALPGLKFQIIGYDYSPDTGPADYGRELDLQVDYAAKALHPNLLLSWRTGQYFAEDLFSDALRTSVNATLRF